MSDQRQQQEGAAQRDPADELPEAPWARSADELLDELEVEPDSGLSEQQVQQRRDQFGPNSIRTEETTSAWQVLIDQFLSGMTLLLALAAVASFAVGETLDAFAIIVVVLINAVIGFVTELRAIRSMEALEELASVSARVRRDGSVREIDAEEMVPGDVVLVDAGDIVSADIRLLECSRLQADESSLTGESVPVAKETEPVAADTVLADRTSMLYRGTAVSSGSGLGVVTATGMATELGLISSLTASAKEAVTPLEKRMDRLSHKLIFLTLGIVAVVAVAGILRNREAILMLETAIALAVATVPEGLPIVTTTALGRGMLLMARNNALINRLSAVETLGATNVIAVDKTGTLTEGRMAVRRIELAGHSLEVTGPAFSSRGELREDGRALAVDDIGALKQALTAAVLCNDASLEEDGGDRLEATGEPLEIALLVAGAKAGVTPGQLSKEMPQVRKEAFDPDRKMMATVHQSGNGMWVAVKGAPESVLDASARMLGPNGEKDLSEQERRQWLDRNERMAQDGLRVLALAGKDIGSEDDDVYEDLTILGLVGMIDPPRQEAKTAVTRCQRAGIRFIMMTGDQPLTALNIARAVGLVDEDHPAQEVLMKGSDLKAPEEMTENERHRALNAQVFARVSPAQKLDLVALHQAEGRVIAMTGDGVNDAPALKKADIGVAMGKRGTQVAREASDMILQDDQLETIVAAVEQGRIIFGNIRKFVLFLLSCNVSEVLVVGLATLASSGPLPILPLQILFLNLVTDVFPALALGVGEGDPHVMEQPPRDPSEPVMARRHWIDLAVYGTMITAATLLALWLGLNWLGLEQHQAITVSFLTLAAAQLWHVFDMRDRRAAALLNTVTRNPWIWGALALCAGLLVAALEVPLLSRVLDTSYPGPMGLQLVLVMSIAPLIGGQIYIGIKNLIAGNGRSE